MALINCKDCNSEISDSAESCPNCGAPVPKTIGADEDQCPHCMTIVHESATTCPNCRAKKGYLYGGTRHGAMSKSSVIMWIVILIVLSVVSIPAGGGILALLFLPLALYFAYSVKKGPKWYASKNVS